MAEVVKEERSLGDLFTELATETSTLVRQEVALAQSEITQKAIKIGTNIGFLAVGGGIGLLALFALLAALIAGVAQLLYVYAGLTAFAATWISALVVGVVIAIIAGVLVMRALAALRETSPVPEQTIESVKEDAQWLKDQVS